VGIVVKDTRSRPGAARDRTIMEVYECYDGPVKTVTALDLRKHFGRLLDEAGRGERIVIERAGQPIAALVPLSDLVAVDPEQKRARQLAAHEELRRLAREFAAEPGREPFDAVEFIRRDRDGRAAHIMDAIAESRRRR
jgi:prevent-host-death family protein